MHIQGVAKFYNTRLADAIIALTGARFTKSFTSHDLRRTKLRTRTGKTHEPGAVLRDKAAVCRTML